MRRFVAWYVKTMFIGLVGLAGALAAPRAMLSQETPKVGPLVTQVMGVGATALVGEASSNVGGALFYNAALSRLYLGVAFNVFSTDGVVSAANDFQIGYAFVHKNDPAVKDRVAFAIAAGYWMPDEGDGSPMVALNGFSAPSRWPVTMHLMAGYVIPEVGDPVFAYRFGLAWVF